MRRMTRNKPPARTAQHATRRDAAAIGVQQPGRGGAAAPKRAATGHQAAERGGFAVTVVDGCLPGMYRLRRAIPAKGKVSIIIPTCAAHGHIENYSRTVRTKTGRQGASA